jgi:general secretion pathway protein M
MSPLDSPLVQRGLAYWRGLAARERLIVAAGALVVGVLLLYGVLWLPMQRDLDSLRANLPREHEQLLSMRAQAGRIKLLRAAAPTAVQSDGLLSFVEQSATAFSVRPNIKRIEPQGTNAVSLAIDGVAFDSLVAWLANLQKQGGVRIDNANLEPLPTPGIVNARLLLRGGGS